MNQPIFSLAGQAVEVLAADRPRLLAIVLTVPGDDRWPDPPESLLVSAGWGVVRLTDAATWWSDRQPTFEGPRTAERWLLEVGEPACRAHWPSLGRGTALLGSDLGGQAALRMAFRHADRFPVTAARTPAIDWHDLYGQGFVIDALYPDRERCRQDSALLHVNPSAGPRFLGWVCPVGHRWYRGCDRLGEKLRALGITHHCLDSVMTDPGPDLWQRLTTALERESRRLL